MKHYSHKLALAGATASALCGLSVGVYGQSADALLDKLVDKGVLTVKEANELREEADAGFRKSYQVKSGMPDWVTALKINGDFRGRYEMFESPNDLFVDRSRFRYRMRVGVVASMTDNFEAGFRLTSSEANSSFGGDPISGNTTFQDNGSKKFAYIDLAYGRWSFINTKEITSVITIGKMENPFLFSDGVFDFDYTPEGAGYNLTYRLNDVHALKLNAGAFVLDEIAADHNDPWMYGGQVRWDAAWSRKVASTLGVGALNIVNEQALTNGAVPAVNRGNSRDAGTGILSRNFNPVIVDAAITYSLEELAVVYKGPFPIRLGGEYMNNLAASDRQQGWQAGLTLGKAGKRGLWEISYRYKYLEGDSWYEELTDSDFGAFYAGTLPNSGSGAGYGAGTNVKGHVARISYSPFDAITLTASYFRTKLVDEIPAGSDSDMTRLQVDAVWKF